ncbi:hypothetical protein BSLG_002426 [Batrachochytrium salamandrivorans]|nr:hypothetical protein BSLG_002426 [Batrachochytrium salamandrivorans]
MTRFGLLWRPLGSGLYLITKRQAGVREYPRVAQTCLLASDSSCVFARQFSPTLEFLSWTATAAVDSVADRRIQASIETQFKHTTVLSIAHRLNTIAAFDRVLVLDAGVVVEFDAPHVLLQQEGSIFAELVDATGLSNGIMIRQIASKLPTRQPRYECWD